MNRKRITSTLALGLLIAAWCLASAAAALADSAPPPTDWTPTPKITPVPTPESPHPTISAPGDVPAPADSSGDDGRTGTLAIAGAVVVLVAGGSVFALRRASKAATADSAAADAPPTGGQSGDEGDS